MNERDLLDVLLTASHTREVTDALAEYEAANPNSYDYQPVGRRENNIGAIEVASDPARSMIERVTNMLDALLEREHELHNGTPDCRTPREAARAWLGVPERRGLSGLTKSQRQDLAKRAVLRLEPGEGSNSRIVTVIDQGVGIAPNDLEGTILSLNESNKIKKHYLAGTYGQGGSSTFLFCKFAAIISRREGSANVGFTVVKYLNLPPDLYKTGRYVFLVKNNAVPEAPAAEGDPKYGTIVRHFGYNLSGYKSVLGPKSVYGILGRVLFDPVLAIRFENRVNNFNRTIKGARNALNGAVDDGDDAQARKLDHYVRMFNLELGDHGSIGIEYWVLALPEKKPGKRRGKPSKVFVDPAHPVILTHNGQNQGELTGHIIKDDKRGADLPFLQTQARLICHVNCDRLSPEAKRLLFSSTREQSREGYIMDRIRSELIANLRADDELKRLNEEAREQSLREKDAEAQKNMRQRVAKLLRIAGAALHEAGGRKKGAEDGPDVPPRPPRPKPLPIEPKEPPTFLRIVWDEEREIPFHANRRRYVRVETDANSDYHDPDDPAKSRLNIAVGDDLRVFGSSPLTGGRMRIGVECLESVVEGASGSIRVELYRPGLPTLCDEREYQIVAEPPPKEGGHQRSLPYFELIPVSGPEDENWEFVVGDMDDRDVIRHASNFTANEGKLYIYYSEAFPRFATEVRRFEQQGEGLAPSFRTRYELWLAVHALLMHQQAEQEDSPESADDAQEEAHRQERVRLAIISVMVASQEVTSGIASEDEGAAAA